MDRNEIMDNIDIVKHLLNKYITFNTPRQKNDFISRLKNDKYNDTFATQLTKALVDVFLNNNTNIAIPQIIPQVIPQKSNNSDMDIKNNPEYKKLLKENEKMKKTIDEQKNIIQEQDNKYEKLQKSKQRIREQYCKKILELETQISSLSCQLRDIRNGREKTVLDSSDDENYIDDDSIYNLQDE
tara:strand:+ start:2486 stop:3037 length:552 start_codon:yes stop_codon:yes gene_type:complete